MTLIVRLEEIKDAVKTLDVISLMEAGFIAYSEGRVTVPPVGEMVFKDPPGDVHIKYGYITDDPYYVVKIASGFCENRGMDSPPRTD